MSDLPINDYNLEAAFSNNPQPGIAFDDVESIEAAWDDGCDETEYIWLLKLKDGRWCVGSGGHDYTGWDCHSSFITSIYPTRDEAIRFGMTLNDRENLGLLLPEEQD